MEFSLHVTRRMSLCISLFVMLALPEHTRADLYRVSLDRDPRAVCSDGTPAAYYRSNEGSQRDYVVYLEGGGYCHDVDACDWRCGVRPSLCTSPTSNTLETDNGILSSDPRVNPNFHGHFKVDLPYCTSDMFIGRRVASDATKGHHFQGLQVFTAMIDSLMADTGLSRARRVILGGSSAGGAGVVFNCEYLKKILPDTDVHCVVDAALFYPLTHPFYQDGDACESIDKVLKMGGALWKAPEASNLDLERWWKGFRGRLFISIARFDEFGIESFCRMENSTGDLNMWNRGMKAKVSEVMRTAPGVGLFVPGCIGHVMLDDDFAFGRLPVAGGGMTLGETLQNWIDRSGQTHTVDVCAPGRKDCQKYC